MAATRNTVSTHTIVRHDLLARIREVENTFVEMADGVQLAARLFLPAQDGPVPALLEYIPYRKRDFMRARDEPMHRYFAAHGYAVVRVDVRGSGDSGGVLADEYSDAEIDDGVAVIDWIARQPWCTGAVGMMGISWGGFNALQVAARRPPALQAVITVCASDDRYADDAHYMGGCLLNENMQWGSILMTYTALPPDPQIVGPTWRDLWRARLEGLTAFPAAWMREPWRGDYWRPGSVCEDYRAIACPVYAIGGWADAYSNAVGRLLAGLTVPRKGLIGPWSHNYPHRGAPGPRIGFMQEALRWWDHWLRGVDTGIVDEPMLRVWMQESVPPAPEYASRPGRWVAEVAWPSSRITPRRWAINRGRLADDPQPGRALELRSPQITGAVSGEWCAFGAPGEMPLDQRVDDGRSLVFDTEPLPARLEILGAPVVELELSVDAPVAMIAVRLNEVAPGGASTRVTFGLLNLTHRSSHEAPTPLSPGERVRVRIELNDVAHAFSPRHRIRLAVSTACWPMAWPPPRPVTLTLWPGPGALELPVRPPDPHDADLPPLPDPEEAPGIEHQPLLPVPFRRSVERDLVTDTVTYRLDSDGGEFGNHAFARLEPIDLTLGYGLAKRHAIQVGDPLSARTEVDQWVELRREGWEIRVEVATQLQAEEQHLHFTATLRATEGGAVVYEQAWDERIPRRLL